MNGKHSAAQTTPHYPFEEDLEDKTCRDPGHANQNKSISLAFQSVQGGVVLVGNYVLILHVQCTERCETRDPNLFEFLARKPWTTALLQNAKPHYS